jgi:hypothetical protein
MTVENLSFGSITIDGTVHNSCLPVMDEVYNIAAQKGVELIVISTPEAVKHINDAHTNLILLLTC